MANVTPTITADIAAEWENALAGSGILFLSGIGLMAYVSVLFAIKRNRTAFKSSFYTLVFSLGVSDSTMLCLYVFYSVPCTWLQRNIFGETFDKAMGVLCNLTYYSSLPAISSIALNRYWAVCRPTTVDKVYSKLGLGINLSIIWAIGVAACSFQTNPCCHLRYYYDLYCWSYDVTLWGFPYYSTWENSFVAFVAISSLVSYIPIGLKQRKAKTAIAASKRNKKSQQNSEVKMAIQFFIVAVYTVFFAIVFTTLPTFTEYRWHLYFSTIVYIGNCSINPFVYLIMSRSVRREVFKLYGIHVGGGSSTTTGAVSQSRVSGKQKTIAVEPKQDPNNIEHLDVENDTKRISAAATITTRL